MIYIIATIRHLASLIKSNNKTAHIFLDDIAGDFDKIMCKNFCHVLNIIVPRSLRERMYIYYTTHSPEFIDSIVKYCRRYECKNYILGNLSPDNIASLLEHTELQQNNKFDEIKKKLFILCPLFSGFDLKINILSCLDTMENGFLPETTSF